MSEQPHSDLPASFASDAPPTGRQWLDTAIRFDQSEQSSRHATTTATLHRTCLRHIPIFPHRSRVTRHLPADNGWILLSDSTNQRRATAGYCYQILTNQRRAMAGYCYQILTNQSVPPMRGTDGHRTFISPHFLL